MQYGNYMSDDTRWFHPRLDDALFWCGQRHEEGIHCTVAALAEYATNREQSESAMRDTVAAIRMIARKVPDSTISIKPTAFGVLFDPAEYERNLSILIEEAQHAEVGIEIDMEGRDLVDITLQSAQKMAEEYPVTVALQAYLDRTEADCRLCISKGIRVRLVKGAYLGDVKGFAEIQERLKKIFQILLASGENFSVGTHDPEITTWIERDTQIPRHQIELGFLMGLADETKLRLAQEGWDVSEYVPYGSGGTAYRKRRERYISLIQEAGRSLLP